jgi:hypothetical protein
MNEFSKRTVGWAQAALVAIGLLGTVVGRDQGLAAQEAIGQPVTAYLDYREVSYDVVHWPLKATKRSSAFKKEPVLSPNNVLRGVLQLGAGATNEMAFAWDRHSGKLYLDLNRNLDLTDDPAGVFSNEYGFGTGYGTFTNVHLPLRTPVGECQALVDLGINTSMGIYCSAGVRSFWQGKVTLQGVEWQIGLLSNLLGPQPTLESCSLLLRPWAERNKPFSLHSGSLEAFPFSSNLFVANHAYQLRCTGEAQGSAAKVRVQFTEQQPGLGELKITGDSVQRVTLEGGPYMVVVDKPEAVVKVPVGSYVPYRVCVKKGEVEAVLTGPEPARRITINDKKPAVLTAGGPLTNSVSVSRQGRKLALSYKLLGAGGVYEVADLDRSHPPEFTVYQGDKKIGAGQFQYG